VLLRTVAIGNVAGCGHGRSRRLREFSRKCASITSTDLLKACQNLLILDKRLNVFRFAHLSAEEFLETQLHKVDSHTEIAKLCLSLFCSLGSWTDYDGTLETGEGRYQDRHLLLYSAVFWLWHLNHRKDACQILEALGKLSYLKLHSGAGSTINSVFDPSQGILKIISGIDHGLCRKRGTTVFPQSDYGECLPAYPNPGSD